MYCDITSSIGSAVSVAAGIAAAFLTGTVAAIGAIAQADPSSALIGLAALITAITGAVAAVLGVFVKIREQDVNRLREQFNEKFEDLRRELNDKMEWNQDAIHKEFSEIRESLKKLEIHIETRNREEGKSEE